QTLRFTRFGPGDPTTRRAAGMFVKAWRSPEGEVTLRLERTNAASVNAASWGPGARWALERVPALLGFDDHPPVVERGEPHDETPYAGRVATLSRRCAGLRLARVPWPLDKLLATILEQRVAFEDAAASWRSLLWRWGDSAPGPESLRMLPAPAILLGLGDHDWRRIGVDRQRQGALREALRYAHRVQETVDMDLPSIRRRIGALRGVGPWTVDMTMGFAFGDADAVPVGDYHLPDLVSWALAGEARADDARMLALLEPYAGQRFRILRWLYASGSSAPRRSPRPPLPDWRRRRSPRTT
ncbi:MAG: DNA-3-methyladenine glycosylase 2 family protein, partial [Acidobacteriota bacterium]|nr:DNA-3-methyladenine glycosylase 2 family protein [Acidobacteriota bacterium]